LKFILRIWITLTSISSFVAGWILLAHSPKPVQNTQTAGASNQTSLEPLAPLSGLSESDGNQSPLFFSPQPQFRMSSSPFFRTGGS